MGLSKPRLGPFKMVAERIAEPFKGRWRDYSMLQMYVQIILDKL